MPAGALGGLDSARYRARSGAPLKQELRSEIADLGGLPSWCRFTESYVADFDENVQTKIPALRSPSSTAADRPLTDKEIKEFAFVVTKSVAREAIKESPSANRYKLYDAIATVTIYDNQCAKVSKKVRDAVGYSARIFGQEVEDAKAFEIERLQRMAKLDNNTEQVAWKQWCVAAQPLIAEMEEKIH